MKIFHKFTLNWFLQIRYFWLFCTKITIAYQLLYCIFWKNTSNLRKNYIQKSGIFDLFIPKSLQYIGRFWASKESVFVLRLSIFVSGSWSWAPEIDFGCYFLSLIVYFGIWVSILASLSYDFKPLWVNFGHLGFDFCILSRFLDLW